MLPTFLRRSENLIFNSIRTYSKSASPITTGLKIENVEKISRIEFNRPEKFNAITWNMYEGLIVALNEASQNKSTSLTVFTGNGDYYCSGNDLSNFTRAKTPAEFKELADMGERILEEFVRAHITHEKPLVALINGPAIGLSVTVLALFDLVIASDKATFHTPFTSLGQSPEGCSSYTFPYLMGPTKAAELLIFDQKIGAEEALKRNLITRIIPHEKFRQQSEELVKKLSQLPAESLRINKNLLRDFHRDTLIKVNVAESKMIKSRWLAADCQNALKGFTQRKNKM